MTKKSTRLLAAIMFTDMVGYTAMMQEDELKAKNNRDRHRKILNESITAHCGEILQYYGDGTLSIFKSAIDAVGCAVKIQQELQKDPRIPLRIGIHCGDIVYDNEGVYGDCVNVASRIENLAVSGSILISDKVYDEIKNQPFFSKASLGTIQLKNVKRPVSVYAISNEGLVVPSVNDIRSGSEAKTKSLAVLPFVNISSDPENEYFSDGITEEIINALTNLESLKVIARTSAFAFKGKYEDVRTIGKKLSVDTILEGSVRKVGKRLRITAQLINISDGSHIWSERYDREMENVFDIQDEISLAIVDKLKVKLLGQEKAAMLKRHTQDLDAYNLYLKGRFFLDSRHEDALQKAMGCFKKAFEKDPAYTLAYIGLADCHNILGFHTFIKPLKAFPEARSLALKALELDDTIGEGHATYGFLKWAYEWDWKGAEQELKRAIELNPMYPNVHWWYSLYLITMGRVDESLTEIKLVQQLQPLSVYLRSGMGAILYWARKYDQALDKILEALDMNPDFGTVHFVLGWIYEQTGMFEDSIKAFKRAIEILGFPYMGPLLGHAYAVSGNRKKAEKIISQVDEISREQYVSPYHRSAVHLALNEKDRAFDLLDKAIEERDNWLVTIKIDPRFDGLQSEQRYIRLLEKLGMHE